MASMLACTRLSVHDTHTDHTLCAGSQLTETDRGQHMTMWVGNRLIEITKMVQSEVVCLQEEIQSVIDSRFKSIIEHHQQIAANLEEELGSGGHRIVHYNVPDVRSKKPSGLFDVKAAYSAALNVDGPNTNCKKARANTDTKPVVRRQTGERDVSSKKSTCVSDMKVAFDTDSDSSVDSTTSNSTISSRDVCNIDTEFAAEDNKNTEMVSEHLSTTSVPRPRYKRPARLQALRNGKVKDGATLKPDTVMLCEGSLSALLVPSQEIPCEISDVPSEMVDANTFVSCNADSQDIPKIDWDSAMYSFGVTGNSNKETRFHLELKACLDTQLPKQSETGASQSINNDGKCCNAHKSQSSCMRLASTTFMSWSSASDRNSEESASAMPDRDRAIKSTNCQFLATSQ